MNHNEAGTNAVTLLVVDDDEAIVELIESLLEDEMQVLCARDGWEALTVAAHHQPDLALLDLMMPGINGLTLTEELRKLPFSERLRIFVMTAHRGLRPEVERLHVDGFFAKPFEPDYLMDALLGSLSQPLS